MSAVPHPQTWPRVRLLEVRAGVSVWEVDGEAIRRDLDIEFTNFGQHWRYPFVPLDEVWIDQDEAHEDEYALFTDNVLAQRRAMQAGEPYERALAIGDAVERRERGREGVTSQATMEGSAEKVAACLLQPLPSFWPERIPARYQVWLVNGDLVRQFFDVNFTEGGNFCADWYIPPGQVWIDDQLPAEERPFVVLHEGIEAHLMERGIDYAQAHPRASAAELEAREHGVKGRVLYAVKAYQAPSWLRPKRISDIDLHQMMLDVTEEPESEAARALLDLWSSFAGTVYTTEDIARIAESGVIPARLTDAIRRTYADFTAREVRRLTQGVASDAASKFLEGIDGADTRVVRALAAGDAELSSALMTELGTRAERLAVEMSDDQHAAIQLLVDYFTRTSPSSAGVLAKHLGEFVGLTEREAGWVLNYSKELIDAGMSQSTVDSLVAQYADTLEQARALRIARTEMSYAATAGQYEGLQEARSEGLVEGRVMRQWSTADDEAVCDECAGMDGVIAAEDEPFSSEADDPPLHPNCRCTFDWIEVSGAFEAAV